MTNIANLTTIQSLDHLPADDSLARLEEISACWKALSDLLIPEGDMHVVDRENLGALLRLLSSDRITCASDINDGARLDDCRACWTGLAVLLSPEEGLCGADRDKLAWLMQCMAREQAAALDALRVAVVRRTEGQ